MKLEQINNDIEKRIKAVRNLQSKDKQTVTIRGITLPPDVWLEMLLLFQLVIGFSVKRLNQRKDGIKPPSIWQMIVDKEYREFIVKVVASVLRLIGLMLKK